MNNLWPYLSLISTVEVTNRILNSVLDDIIRIVRLAWRERSLIFIWSNLSVWEITSTFYCCIVAEDNLMSCLLKDQNEFIHYNIIDGWSKKFICRFFLKYFHLLKIKRSKFFVPSSCLTQNLLHVPWDHLHSFTLVAMSKLVAAMASLVIVVVKKWYIHLKYPC